MTSVAAPQRPTGLSDPRFQTVIARLLKTEGGFVDSPSDHGGATNYGLSLRFLAQEARLNPSLIAELDINHDGVLDVPDIKGMTVAEAGSLYYRFFWAPPLASTLPAPIDAAVFDQTVNDGQVPAIKMLQSALNGLKVDGLPPLGVDGALGGLTRAQVNIAIGRLGAPALLDAYRVQVIARYQAIVRADPSQQIYLAGWMNRARELGDV
jgi:lysozyme family protein